MLRTIVAGLSVLAGVTLLTNEASAQVLPAEIAARMNAGPRESFGPSASGGQGSSFRPRPSGGRAGLSGPGTSLRDVTAASRLSPLARPIFEFSPPLSEAARISQQRLQQLQTQQQIRAQRAQSILQTPPRNVRPHQLVFSPETDFVPALNARTPILEEVVTRVLGPEAEDVRIDVRGEVAILTGVVPTQRQANLLARVLRLEPGIYGIDNRLRIGSIPAPPPPQSESRQSGGKQ